MSIDFSKLKELIIPEGKVTQIADASGRVLWSAVEPMTKLALTQWTLRPSDASTSVTIVSPEPFAPDPNNPSNVTTSWTITGASSDSRNRNRVIEIPIGSTIECVVSGGATTASISLNGNKIVNGSGTYIHTVTRGTRINIGSSSPPYGIIQIYEDVPEDPVTINLIRDATATWGTFQAKHNGITYDFPATFEANVGDKIDVICLVSDEDEDSIYSFTGSYMSTPVGSSNYTYPVVYDTKMVASITEEYRGYGTVYFGNISIQRV